MKVSVTPLSDVARTFGFPAAAYAFRGIALTPRLERAWTLYARGNGDVFTCALTPGQTFTAPRQLKPKDIVL